MNEIEKVKVAKLFDDIMEKFVYVCDFFFFFPVRSFVYFGCLLVGGKWKSAINHSINDETKTKINGFLS